MGFLVNFGLDQKSPDLSHVTVLRKPVPGVENDVIEVKDSLLLVLLCLRVMTRESSPGLSQLVL